MTELRVLTCVFSCCPPGTPGFNSGEDALGRNLLEQIGRFHHVWALTLSENRTSIEQAADGTWDSKIHFCYVGLPKWLGLMLRFQGTHQFYYYLWQIRAYFVARKLHQQHRFDLFHHITYANDWMVSFIGALLPIPYIRGPGGGAHRTPKGFGREYSLGGRVWEGVRTLGQWLFRHDPMFLRGQSRASAILVCNQESMSQIPDKWAAKAQLFPVNGVSSADLMSGGQPKSRNGKFRILTAGSLIRVKGFALAIKAFKEFEHRNPDAEFSIIGSGPEEPRLRELVRRSDLGQQVKFLPSMTREALLTQMASCDVFLFPSLRDGGGAVVIEAMAAGKPVVCLDTGGPGMHVTEECGVKINPSSPQRAVVEIAEALDRLCRNENLRLELGKGAAKRASRMYHWDRLGERLMVVYRDVVATGGSI